MSEYDYKVVTPWLLGEIKALVAKGGRVPFSKAVAHMNWRGLVVTSLYHVDLKPICYVLARDIAVGSRVVIGDKFHIIHRRGCQGVVESMTSCATDAGVLNDQGELDRKVTWKSCVTVRLDDEPGQWCFWRVDDLELETCSETNPRSPNNDQE